MFLFFNTQITVFARLAAVAFRIALNSLKHTEALLCLTKMKPCIATEAAAVAVRRESLFSLGTSSKLGMNYRTIEICILQEPEDQISCLFFCVPFFACLVFYIFTI